MTRLIADRHWHASFRRADGKYAGELFEQLALHLLERLYGTGWRPTSRSHDGSRDYEKQDDDGLIWAECKAYSEKLSIYVLSPTLIMALLEDPHTVIIISRSPLNRNAVRHLASFQVRTKKLITILDGGTLDEAIVAAGVHRLYFPALEIPPSQLPRLRLECAITCDAFTSPADTDLPLPAHHHSTTSVETVRLGVIRLDLVVRNLNPLVSIRIRVEIAKGSLDTRLRLLAFSGRKGRYHISAILQPSGLSKLSIYLQATASGTFALPDILVTHKGAPPERIRLGRIRVAPVFELPLVGIEHRRAFEEGARLLRHRRQLITIAIEGASGTGKSRLLRELALVGLQEGLRCHTYNPELEDPKAAERTIKSLLADIFELPLADPLFDRDNMAITSAVSPHAALVARVLYDESFVISDRLLDIVEILIPRLATLRTLIILDNTQSAPDLLASFFDLLTSALRTAGSIRVALVACFNTDLLHPDSSAGTLLRKLRGWGAEAPETARATLHRVLPDFSRQDVSDFLAEALSASRLHAGSVEEYTLTLDLLLANVQPRPLNLWQTVLYLADEGALTADEGRLQFTGDVTLLHRLDSLPPNLQDLLQLRWLRISQRAVDKGITKNALDWTIRVSYIVGAESRRDILALGASNAALNHLITTGILAVDPGDRIRFFHFQLFVFCRSLCSNWDPPVALRLYNRLRHKKLTATKFQPYLIVSHHAGRVSRQLLRTSVEHMAAHGLSREYWREYSDLLLGYLQVSGRRPSTMSLVGIRLIGHWQQRLQSHLRAADTFRSFLTMTLLRHSRTSLLPDPLVDFYHEAANSFLAVYADAEALEVLEVALTDVQRIHFDSLVSKQLACARILNRKLATLKNFGRLEEALEAGRAALESLAVLPGHSLAIETLFDMGGLLLRVPERRAEGWSCLQEGCSLFVLHRAQMREPAPCRYFFTRGQIAIQHGDLREAVSYTSAGVLHCRRVSNHFWGIRLLTLEVVARLLLQHAPADAELRSIPRLLTQLRDWLNVSQAERSRWAIEYLEGKYQLFNGNHNLAAEAFQRALSDLAQRLSLAEQVSWRAPIIRDIAASVRRHRLQLSPRVFDLLQSDSIRAETRTILAMSDELFAQFEKERAALALFCHDGTIVELP